MRHLVGRETRLAVQPTGREGSFHAPPAGTGPRSSRACSRQGRNDHEGSRARHGRAGRRTGGGERLDDFRNRAFGPAIARPRGGIVGSSGSPRASDERHTRVKELSGAGRRGDRGAVGRLPGWSSGECDRNSGSDPRPARSGRITARNPKRTSRRHSRPRVGQSTGIGIGGDPVKGQLRRLPARCAATRYRGRCLTANRAEWRRRRRAASSRNFEKPVVRQAGRTAPRAAGGGRRAIMMGPGTAAEKTRRSSRRIHWWHRPRKDRNEGSLGETVPALRGTQSFLPGSRSARGLRLLGAIRSMRLTTTSVPSDLRAVGSSQDRVPCRDRAREAVQYARSGIRGMGHPRFERARAERLGNQGVSDALRGNTLLVGRSTREILESLSRGGRDRGPPAHRRQEFDMTERTLAIFKPAPCQRAASARCSTASRRKVPDRG